MGQSLTRIPWREFALPIISLRIIFANTYLPLVSSGVPLWCMSRIERLMHHKGTPEDTKGRDVLAKIILSEMISNRNSRQGILDKDCPNQNNPNRKATNKQ